MNALLRPLRSVRGRITLISSALVAVTLILASLLLIRLVREDLLASAEETIDEALAAQAEQFGVDDIDGDFGLDENFGFVSSEIDGSQIDIGVFTEDPTDPFGLAFGELYVDGELSALLVLEPDSGDIVEILDVDSEAPLEDRELRDQIESLVFETFELSDLDSDDAGSRFLVGATPLQEIEESVDAVEEALVFIVPALTVLFGLSTWLLVGRALRPVSSITRQVEEISSSNLDTRVPVPRTEDEVAELASVMNGMLDRLERGGERQRQFSADASHELRSPLSTVRAAAEVLGRKPESERVGRLSDDIIAESDRMNDLIGDLLELSRLDEDRRPLDMDDFDLVRLLRDELGEDVRLHTPGSVPFRGSPGQVRRLVRNLVDNARRHAARQVTVSLTGPTASEGEDRGEGGGTVSLTVDDDGPGIPPDERSRIFERFARLDDARAREAGGSGLGLALVRAIVERHRGTIIVDDAPQGGARFVVTLPTAPPAVPAGSGPV